MIKVARPYDFKLSLFPSLNYVLFDEVSKGVWIKLFGFKKGSIIEFLRGDEIRFSGFNEGELIDHVGLWYDPQRYIKDVDSKYLDVIDALISRYSCVGLPIAPKDPAITFISAFLNRVTNYHTNVVRWVRTILKLTNENIDSINEGVVRKVSNSFQLIGLPQALRDFKGLNLSSDYWSLRQSLMRIKFVGPKVADLFLLHWRGFYEAVPIDIHIVRMVRRLGIVNEFKLPSKSLCANYTCSTCPNVKCLGRVVREKLGRLAPWFQTISYIHDRLYCSRKLCSDCMLNNLCNKQ
ncbi:MAG: hypothetical protein DRO18_07925 [Thermoprotei archaeon]|nr:MAG: hypothetical protein DRO18_07925 [Thermoprotei archaeon]